LIALLLLYFAASEAEGQSIDGFTQPYRSAAVSSEESGVIVALLVEEGDRVQRGDVIARLDDRVHQVQLELAEQRMNSTSELDAARLAFEKREAIHEQLLDLREQSHASQSELIRSELELAIARSKYLAAQEAAASREIEYRRSRILAEKRVIRASFDGIIAAIHIQEGEFVSPVNPEIATLVQIDTLLAVFNLPADNNPDLKLEQTVDVTFANGKNATGTVYRIGAVLDAESGTIPVKILIDNSSNQLRSGMQCQLVL